MTPDKFRIAEAIFLRILSSESMAAIMAPRHMEGMRTDFPTDRIQEIAERAVISAHIFEGVCERAEAAANSFNSTGEI